MSTRPYLKPNPVIKNGDMSGNVTSLPTLLVGATKASYAFSWAGTTPVGTVALQGSNDYALNPDGTTAVAGTWSTFTLQYMGTSVQSVPVTGNTGTGMIDIETGANAVRVVYTAGSGTGILQAVFTGKVA